MDLAPGASDVIDRLHVGSVAAAWRPRAGGGAVVGVEDGFVLIDADGTLHRRPAFSDSGAADERRRL